MIYKWGSLMLAQENDHLNHVPQTSKISNTMIKEYFF